MRLTCPNCRAQYEVDDSVVPRGGRDVQCSACGHTWYQYPKEVALEMRAAELEDDDDDEPGAGPGPRAANAAPRIDKTVLDVLREEADREMAERRRDRSSLESQGDLGLARPARSKAAPSRIFGEDDPATLAPPPPPLPDPEADESPREAPRRRRILPDIEELTSTLEPAGDARTTEAGSDEAPSSDRQGMRRGLTVVMLVAVGLVVLYKLGPTLGAWVPALEGVLTPYVDTINFLRGTVSGMLRGLLGG